MSYHRLLVDDLGVSAPESRCWDAAVVGALPHGRYVRHNLLGLTGRVTCRGAFLIPPPPISDAAEPDGEG